MDHRNGTLGPILASPHRLNPRFEGCSYPFSDSLFTKFSGDGMRRPTPRTQYPWRVCTVRRALLGPIWKEDRPLMDGNKDRPQTTAGLDLGDRYSYLCLLDTDGGEIIEEGRVRTTPEALRRRFASEQPLRIAIETGTHSPWVSRLLEECGHEVLVANARKLRLIYANKRGARHGPIRRAGSTEAHLKGRRRDAAETPGLERPLRPWSLRLGLGPQTPRREDSLPRGQQRQEAGGGGSGQEAICALASVVG
jgi:hypothetical protein